MNQTAPSQLQTENRFPDCVLMKLHCAPVEPEQPEQATTLILSPGTRSPTTTTRTISLKLTIRFHKQTIKLPGGEVEFGLKRGELDLKLINGRIPLEKMGLVAAFELEVEVEEQQEQGREAEANIAVAGGVKTKDASKRTIKTKSKRSRVANRGTEENPIWEFSMEPNLSGRLAEESLGTIELNGLPCRVDAAFSARSQSDVELFDVAGLLKAKNLSRNKTAWATREFFLRFIAPKLQPHLSRVEGQL
jgi:hypothetical protein